MPAIRDMILIFGINIAGMARSYIRLESYQTFSEPTCCLGARSSLWEEGPASPLS